MHKFLKIGSEIEYTRDTSWFLVGIGKIELCT